MPMTKTKVMEAKNISKPCSIWLLHIPACSLAWLAPKSFTKEGGILNLINMAIFLGEGGVFPYIRCLKCLVNCSFLEMRGLSTMVTRAIISAIEVL